MKIFLIEGISGTGKTTICEELKSRGYQAIEADEEIAQYLDPKTGQPTTEMIPTNWLWNQEKFDRIIEQSADAPIFICGDAMNKEAFKDYFEKIFTLYIDDETLTHRLATRTNNNFGKHPDELALQIEWNQHQRQWSKERGTVLVDATRPVSEVVDEIVAIANI
ncbi:MAG: AAA family ATPase [Candidatus Buchananbacteria bacterium]|nr:AAA family ATPase [Candidatus Buchananbacteria bacterium]